MLQLDLEKHETVRLAQKTLSLPVVFPHPCCISQQAWADGGLISKSPFCSGETVALDSNSLFCFIETFLSIAWEQFVMLEIRTGLGLRSAELLKSVL